MSHLRSKLLIFSEGVSLNFDVGHDGLFMIDLIPGVHVKASLLLQFDCKRVDRGFVRYGPVFPFKADLPIASFRLRLDRCCWQFHRTCLAGTERLAALYLTWSM